MMSGSAGDPDALETMAEEGRLLSIRSYGGSCRVEIAGAGEAPTHNLIIELSNDNGSFNRASYYRKALGNDSGFHQGTGDFMAGLIFDNVTEAGQPMNFVCRVNRQQDLSANPCRDSVGFGQVFFPQTFRSGTNNAFAFNANYVEEITAAASLCCRNEQCVGRTLLAADEYRREQSGGGGGFFGCWWNCGDSDEGTN